MYFLLLLTLSSWAPTRVLLPSVIRARRKGRSLFKTKGKPHALVTE